VGGWLINIRVQSQVQAVGVTCPKETEAYRLQMPLSKHFIVYFYSGGKKNKPHITKSAKHLFWNNFRLKKRFKNSSKNSLMP